MAVLKKICKQCKKERLIKFFRVTFTNGKPYTRGCCKDCDTKNTRKWRRENVEKYEAIKKRRREEPKQGTKYERDLANRKKWAEENRPKVLRKNKRYYKTNRALILKTQKKRRKYNTKKLTDTYVIHTLIGNGSILKAKQIREIPHLIEAKRMQLQIRRMSNQ